MNMLKNKYFVIYILFASLLVMYGCASSGAIICCQNVNNVMDDYDRSTRELVKPSSEKMLYVLHRAGSINEYAKNINDPDFSYGANENKIKDVSELMDRSFNDLKAEGIEIDAQTITKGEYQGVYIVHDKIDEDKLSDAGKMYLLNNNLQQVVSHFIEKRYFDEELYRPHGKFLYIELKLPKKLFHLNHSPLNKDEQKYIKETISEIEKSIEEHIEYPQKRSSIRQHIAFVSFNIFALEKAHEIIGNKDSYKIYFILTNNRGLLGQLASVFASRQINYLTSKLENKLKSFEWLTGIWFAPVGVRHIAETFNGINEHRNNKLNYYISTYQSNRENYLNRLIKSITINERMEIEKLENVRGLIFDIEK
jgi:hypothetical protein